MLSVQTVACFNSIDNGNVNQFVRACIESKKCRTFQVHANAVLAEMGGYTSWEKVEQRLLELNNAHNDTELFELEDEILDARAVVGIDTLTRAHARKLCNLQHTQSQYMNQNDLHNAARAQAGYIALCKQ